MAARSSIIFVSNTISDSSGSQGGVVYMINSSLVMQYSTFEHNLALRLSNIAKGGMIYSIEESTISMKLCTFRSNSAWYSGVIYYEGTNLTLNIEYCYFRYNYANGEGGVFYFTKPYLSSETLAKINAKISIRDSKFHGNRIGNKGGVIYSASTANLAITDNTNVFTKNSGPEGAIMYVASFSSTIKSSNTYINDNCATKQGIVFLQGTTASYWGVRFTQNKGSVLIAIEADVTFLWKMEFIGNKAHQSLVHFNGGAISSIRSVIKFNADCKLSNNEAHTFGGAIVSLNSHIHILGNTYISNNRAVLGGGLYLYQSELLCKNVINTNENLANSSGGGIYSSMSFIRLSDKGSLVYVKNHAQFGGGMFLTRNSKINIQGLPVGEGFLLWSLRVLLVYNVASKGGGIFIDDETNSFSCWSPLLGQYLEDECFIQATLSFNQQYLTYLIFKENEATHGGSDIYGGLIDRCRPSPLSSDKPLVDYILSLSNIKKTHL